MDAPRALLIDCSFVFYIVGVAFCVVMDAPGARLIILLHTFLYNVGTAFGVALDATGILLSDFSYVV